MEEKLNYLIKYLLNERSENINYKSLSLKEKEKLYKALVNIRMPYPISKQYLQVEDEYLQEKLKGKGIININSLEKVDKNIYLYLGDITQINSDLIVNAGNSDGLGCFNPAHLCIDNTIHTSAGMRLRLECNHILKGRKIKNGNIIVCDAYNLPSKKVITTVGPQITNQITKKDQEDLAKCYKNSMEYAIKNNYKSITFPSISTGLFAYPIFQAKLIAINTVKQYTDNDIKVIFNLFTQEDYNEYRKVFTSKKTN